MNIIIILQNTFKKIAILRKLCNMWISEIVAFVIFKYELFSSKVQEDNVTRIYMVLVEKSEKKQCNIAFSDFFLFWVGSRCNIDYI